MTTTKRTTNITIPVDTRDYMMNILGSVYWTYPWWVKVEYAENYNCMDLPPTDTEPYVCATILDPNDEEEVATITKWLSVNDIVEAGNKGFTLCPWVRWDDMDATDGDIVMQYAMLDAYMYA